MSSWMSVWRCAALVVVVIALVASASAPTWSDVLFYGGDPLGGGCSCTIGPGQLDSRVYDNFIVPSVCGRSSSWRVDCLFGYYAFDTTEPLTSAYYEIRQGISRGNGGTLLYKGTADAALAGTFATRDNGDVYRVECPVSGLTLDPGEYWVTLAPIVTEPSKQYFVSLTEGVNGIGSPILDGLSFVDSPSYRYNWAPGSDWYGGRPDSSIGLIGKVLPEPASLAALAAGLFGLCALDWRRYGVVRS